MGILFINKILIFSYVLWSYLGCLIAQEPNAGCVNRFEYEYKVLQKIVQFEEALSKQEDTIATLKHALKGTKTELNHLREIIQNAKETADGNTYVRWGRTICPEGASLVYHGYAAGSHHTHSGSGSNRLCLPHNPMWGEYVDGYQSTGRLFGSEYEVSEHPFWKHLHDQDVPCAVCRISRSTVLMIPGRYECYDNFTLEYSGYLMSGYYGHASSLEYVCMDKEPEIVDGGHTSKDGALFYFVETSCGSLSCPPYKDGREVTCAVCSFSPKNNTTP